MDLEAELGAQRVVDQTMAPEATHSAKALRSHPHAKVTRSAGRARVATVRVALVDDGESLGRERLAQESLDALASVHATSMRRADRQRERARPRAQATSASAAPAGSASGSGTVMRRPAGAAHASIPQKGAPAP